MEAEGTPAQVYRTEAFRRTFGYAEHPLFAATGAASEDRIVSAATDTAPTDGSHVAAPEEEPMAAIPGAASMEKAPAGKQEE